MLRQYYSRREDDVTDKSSLTPMGVGKVEALTVRKAEYIVRCLEDGMPDCRKMIQDGSSDRGCKDLKHRVWSNNGRIIVDRWSVVDDIDKQLIGIRGRRDDVESMDEKTTRVLEAGQAETRDGGGGEVVHSNVVVFLI